MPKLIREVETSTPWFGTSRVCVLVQQAVEHKTSVANLVKTKTKLLVGLGMTKVTPKEIHQATEMKDDWFDRVREKVSRLLSDRKLQAGWGNFNS